MKYSIPRNVTPLRCSGLWAELIFFPSSWGSGCHHYKTGLLMTGYFRAVSNDGIEFLGVLPSCGHYLTLFYEHLFASKPISACFIPAFLRRAFAPLDNSCAKIQTNTFQFLELDSSSACVFSFAQSTSNYSISTEHPDGDFRVSTSSSSVIQGCWDKAGAAVSMNCSTWWDDMRKHPSRDSS